MSIVVRPLEWHERPSQIPYTPGGCWGGGCEHRYPRGTPCGNSGGYAVGEKKLCWPHASQTIRNLMFKRIPVEIREAS